MTKYSENLGEDKVFQHVIPGHCLSLEESQSGRKRNDYSGCIHSSEQRENQSHEESQAGSPSPKAVTESVDTDR